MLSVLSPCLFGKVFDNLTCESYAGHGVQDGLVGDHVTNTQHLAVQTGLDPVNILSLPDTCCDHEGAQVDEHGSGQTAHELLDYVRVCPSESPPHYFYVLVDLFPCNLLLVLLVHCHSHSQVFDCLGALDSSYFRQVLTGQDLRLLLVESQVPLIL